MSELRAAQQRIRELERALGRKTMEVEILQAARDEVKKSRVGTACRSRDRTRRDDDLPDAWRGPSDGLSRRDAAGTPLCEGGRPRARGAAPRRAALSRERRVSACDGAREPRLRRDLQPQAGASRAGAPGVDAAAVRDAAIRTGAYGARRARPLERALVLGQSAPRVLEWRGRRDCLRARLR